MNQKNKQDCVGSLYTTHPIHPLTHFTPSSSLLFSNLIKQKNSLKLEILN